MRTKGRHLQILPMLHGCPLCMSPKPCS